MKQHVNSDSNPARALALTGGAFFLVGLMLPAVNLQPWVRGSHTFVLSFLGLITLGNGSIPHLVACLLGATANLLMLFTFLRLVWWRPVCAVIPGLALILSIGVLAPLSALGGSWANLVSWGYFAWVGCAGLLLAGGILSRSAVTRSQAPANQADGVEAPPAGKIVDERAPVMAPDARGDRFNISPWVIGLVVLGFVLLAARFPADWWVVVPASLLFGVWMWRRPVPPRSNRFLVRWLLLLLFLAAWWPSGRVLLRASQDGNQTRVRLCLALGVSPNAVVENIPHPWYLGSPGRHTPLYEAIKSGDASMVSLLLRHGANPELLCGEPNDLKSPLNHARAEGNPEVIRLLEKTR